MQQRVFVVLAARNGAAYLADTLRAIDAQTARPEAVVAVDARSGDGSKAQLQASSATHLVEVAARASFGTAVAAGVAQLPQAQDGDWLWLLAHDAYPEPRALERLLGTAETSPSVAVVGPKVLRASDSSTFAEYGETMTPFGRGVLLRGGELDQGQHDGDLDAMGVAASGVLVRRDVFDALGGFDPALPSVDAGLDLGVRARLAGHRVALQPEARVRRSGGPEHFQSRLVSAAGHVRIARAAQLHRRLAYAAPGIVVLQWLALLPLAIARTFWHLATKRLASIPADWLATLQTLVGIGAVARSRRRIRRTRTASWRDLAPLRATWRELREHRQRIGDGVDANARAVDERVGFIEGAGLWVAALAAVASVLLLVPLVGATATTGGALLPLDASIGAVWRHALWGERDAFGDITGPADGLAIVTALLASLTFWSPSLAITIVLFAAMPVAAVTGWFAVRSVTRHRWLPTVGAAVWAFSPTLVTAVHDGRLGAVLAHVLLPVAIACGMAARRSWNAAGAAALAVAGVAAGAPSLLPALAVLWLGAVAWQWRAPRVLVVPIPALLLVGPTLWWQSSAGRPLAALADPGAPFGSDAPLVTDVLLGMPDARLGGLDQVVRAMGIGVDAGWIALVLAAPLVLLALAAPFVRLVGLVPLAVAALGVVTAVVASRLQVVTDGTAEIAVWAGAGTSLAVLGLLLAATVTLTVLDFRAGVPASLVTLASIAAIVPMVALSFTTPSTLEAAPGRTLPAFVVADAQVSPGVGTLVLEPRDDATLAAHVVRGSGLTLDDLSTLETTNPSPTETSSELATVAANLVAAGDVDVLGPLADWGVRYVLLAPGDATATALAERAERSLDELGDLTAVGETDAGTLWQVDVEPADEAPIGAGADVLLVGQLVALLLAVLLALPSGRRVARSWATRGRLVKDWA